MMSPCQDLLDAGIPLVSLVFPVTAFPSGYPGKVFDDFKAHDILRHLVAKLPLQSQAPDRNADG